jgi:hypothetical protein
VVLRHEGAYGVDSRTTLIHSVVATAANVHDRQVFPQLLHGQETQASDRGGARPKPHQVKGPCESGTCVLGDQANLWVGQSPLPSARQEYELALVSCGLTNLYLVRRRLLAET